MQTRRHSVVHPGSARLLMEDSPKRRLLLSMVERARTATDVAAGEKMSIGRAHYLLTSFVKRGLAFVEREEKRRGRPVKHYRSVARSFFVPLEHVSASPGAGLAAEIREKLNEALPLTDDEGVLFDVDLKGEPRVSWFGERHRTKPVAEFWHILKLTEGEAFQLIRDMEKLFKRYEQHAGGGRVFLIHGAVAPRGST